MRVPTVDARKEDHEAQLRLRLQEIIHESSQANVARRTATPEASLSRYLRDRTIPADLCIRLVRGLGVNAGWLLSGDGPVYATEMSAPAREAAAGLLELIEAICASLRTQTASLDAMPSAQLLYRLAGRAREVEQLHARLTDQVQPLFDRLIRELDAAYYAGKQTQAAALLQSLKQLARLGRDAAMQDRLDDALALNANQQGDFPAAMELRSRVFQRSLLRRTVPLRERIEQDANYLANLYHCFSLRAARRASRLLLELHAAERRTPEHALLRLLSGFLDFELGRCSRGWRRMLAAQPLVPSLQRDYFRGQIVQCQIFRGLLSIEEAIALSAARLPEMVPLARTNLARSLARAALALESRPDIEAVLARFDAELHGGDDHAVRLLVLHIRAVARQLAHPGESTFRSYREESVLRTCLASGEYRLRFSALVYAAQLARLAGAAEALELQRAAGATFAAMAREYTPWLALRAVHHRNSLLSAAQAALQARDLRFLGRCRERGYHGIAASFDARPRGPAR